MIPRNSILHGDCIQQMERLDAGSVDFVLTDPPYITHYRDKSGRNVTNDDNDRWLVPAFREIHRTLKSDALCVSFYGWNKAHLFIDAWHRAGFQICGHIVFCKRYASASRFVQNRHEQAYLLAKGDPALPENPPPSLIEFSYTGNTLHPTQKPTSALKPLIAAFTKPGDIVLDPFCGSGSTLAAAQALGRDYIGIEISYLHHLTALRRLQGAADIEEAA